MSSAKALKKCWSDDLTEAACRALSAGEMLSPFGMHEVGNRALHDFRGLNLDHQAVWQYGCQNLRLLEADFSELAAKPARGRIWRALDVAGSRLPDRPQAG